MTLAVMPFIWLINPVIDLTKGQLLYGIAIRTKKRVFDIYGNSFQQYRHSWASLSVVLIVC